MSERWSLAQYRKHAGLGDVEPARVPGKPRNKFNAVRTPGANGRVYASKAEAKHAAKLEAMKQSGEIVAWAPQISIPIGPGEKGRDIRYVADALLIIAVNPDGTFVGRLQDAKGNGVDTPNSRTKRAALRGLYQLDVEVV